MFGNWREWYDRLNKPSWTPAPSTIGLIWTLLYPVIFITYSMALYRIYKGEIGREVLPILIINIAANLAFTFILFGLKNLYLAAIDILIVLATIFGSIYFLWPYAQDLAIVQFPYLLWVSIATILQFSITFSNRK